MTKVELRKHLQQFVAVTTIGPSALRGQGASGVVDAARKYLAKIDLRVFATKEQNNFIKQLDKHTKLLQRSFPKNARNWGAARKAINLFLRDAYYNQFLNNYYHLDRAVSFYEIPLDGVIGEKLYKLGKMRGLPRWETIKGLTVETSKLYQDFAQHVASTYGVQRVHLDAILWTEGR